MKKKLLSLGTVVFCAVLSFGQISEGGKPLSKQKTIVGKENVFAKSYETKKLVKPNLAQVYQEDLQNDSKGKAYRVGINIPVSFNPANAGTWMKMADGSSVWRMSIEVKDAMALGLYFNEDVLIPAGGKLFAYNDNGEQILGAYTSSTPTFQAMEMVEGDKLHLEYHAASWVKQQPVISISDVVYFYRGVEDHVSVFTDKYVQAKAENCQVDVACSESTGWTNQVNSVVHYTFNSGGGTAVCSGATINNTANDCKPYILTAWHCGERDANQSISSWVWYWKYQKTTCSPGSANGTNPPKGSSTMTGGTVRASSGNGTHNPNSSQVAGSDFYLVELNSAIPASYNPYLAGWNRTNTAATSGKGIHHPAGSAKKISTYTAALTSSTYNGGVSNAHWRVIWSATANGHGVTEGGSSGSPIFDQNKRIVGQLSGGSSYCNATNQPDLYGKMFHNWDQNGTTTLAQLKPFLDPGNTGVTTLDGVTPPCNQTPSAPVANFVANQTNVTTGTTVSFTDQSTNSPTSWSWSISPATGWSYAGGTSATSQNPQVTFTTVGQYTVTLTASNAQGSDGETKTNYIVVTAGSTTYCTATSTACDEYISTVTLGSINNSSACTNYGNYVAQSTSLTKGQAYQLTIVPTITGQGQGAYTNDEIAAWIDYNGDFDFDDAGERIAYVLVGSGWSNVFSFTVPQTATNGAKRMRVRISYSTDDGPIVPCESTQYGEVEDYTVNIQGGSSADLDENNPLSLVSVYPNPTSGNMYLDLSALTGKTEVLVFDLTGKLLFAEEVQAGQVAQVSTNKLASGVYQIQLKNNGNESIQRFVKQ